MEPTTWGVLLEVGVGVMTGVGVLWRRMSSVETRLSKSMEDVSEKVNEVKIEVAKMNGKVHTNEIALLSCQSSRDLFRSSIKGSLEHLETDMRETRVVAQEALQKALLKNS